LHFDTFLLPCVGCQTTLTDGALEADVYILTGFTADGIISHKKRQEHLAAKLGPR